MDAIGLPIRNHPTPGQRGEAPQVRNLLRGLYGIGYVISDAAYDAHPLSILITDHLGATAQTKVNPDTPKKESIDWRLYK